MEQLPGVWRIGVWFGLFLLWWLFWLSQRLCLSSFFEFECVQNVLCICTNWGRNCHNWWDRLLITKQHFFSLSQPIPQFHQLCLHFLITELRFNYWIHTHFLNALNIHILCLSCLTVRSTVSIYFKSRLQIHTYILIYIHICLCI